MPLPRNLKQRNSRIEISYLLSIFKREKENVQRQKQSES
jgi:hypothetical protein